MPMQAYEVSSASEDYDPLVPWNELIYYGTKPWKASTRKRESTKENVRLIVGDHPALYYAHEQYYQLFWPECVYDDCEYYFKEKAVYRFLPCNYWIEPRVTLRVDDGRAWYGTSAVTKAVQEGAVGPGGGTLIMNNSLFRSSDIATRKQYVALVDKVKEDGGEVRILSSDHESGQRLDMLGSVAALLSYPIADLDDEDADDADGVEGADDVQII
ncbi:hypothetical protein BN1723_013821 [Verticillium longisporum]|uniref:eRF1 domain-containing protein n=1 Tax=Verticillium longisporum TaxID=100787 RepID=A0A0G4LWE8_VERLO|nr:hypothetical protein BN1723_013821 [Verticillium longisporum]